MKMRREPLRQLDGAMLRKARGDRPIKEIARRMQITAATLSNAELGGFVQKHIREKVCRYYRLSLKKATLPRVTPAA